MRLDRSHDLLSLTGRCSNGENSDLEGEIVATESGGVAVNRDEEGGLVDNPGEGLAGGE